jgi:hypothetical protein
MTTDSQGSTGPQPQALEVEMEEGPEPAAGPPT